MENRHLYPAFQRMLSDIAKGRVNCVIVKDLARSFRNYTDQILVVNEGRIAQKGTHTEHKQCCRRFA